MKALLALSRAIDALNERIGHLVYWLILAMVLVSSTNAVLRYTLSIASNAWLEMQWYMFAAVFLLCAGYTLLHNEHIRIDIFGFILFMLPATIIMTYLSWPIFHNSWMLGEVSSNAGGLVRWPVKIFLPIGFALLTLQGVSELIKRIAMLTGDMPADLHYERPLQ